jgi:Response regulator containing CheY-like receiver domain and AraC-type DNA-binding domain
MYKLVIVDDEPAVRQGLSTVFDWETYGIQLAGQADDGDTGLELIEQVKPDIVLTDIMMPTMDGIRMAQEIRQRFPETKIVFISGHNDADFLKSALQVHAVDYIFKPVKRSELQKVIEKVTAGLRAEEQERRIVQDMQVKLTQSMPLLREKFLLSLLRDGATATGNLQERLEFLSLMLPAEWPYIVLVVTIDDSAEVLAGRSERDKQLLSYSILNVMQELIDSRMKGYAFENRTGEYTGLLMLDEQEEVQEEQLYALAEAVQDNLRRWLKLSVTIGVGGIVRSITSLSASYKQAREAADRKWYLGKNKIITADSLEMSGEALSRFDAGQSEKLISALKAGDRSGVEAGLDDIFHPLATNRKDGFKYGRYMSLQLILLSERVLLDLNLLTKEWNEKEDEVLDRLLKLETMAELIRLVTSYLSDVCAWVEEKRSGRVSHVIEAIQQFVGDHYAENLTLAEISGHVYLSQTYVSLLFKQETGETIYDYLIKVRIEKAKQLLCDPRMKFYEICEAVGYTDPSYFSKLFKRMTGLTPSTYRDQHYN